MALSSQPSRFTTQVLPFGRRGAKRRIRGLSRDKGLGVRTLVAGAHSSACGPRALPFDVSNPEGLRGGNR